MSGLMYSRRSKRVKIPGGLSVLVHRHRGVALGRTFMAARQVLAQRTRSGFLRSIRPACRCGRAVQHFLENAPR